MPFRGCAPCSTRVPTGRHADITGRTQDRSAPDNLTFDHPFQWYCDLMRRFMGSPHNVGAFALTSPLSPPRRALLLQSRQLASFSRSTPRPTSPDWGSRTPRRAPGTSACGRCAAQNTGQHSLSFPRLLGLFPIKVHHLRWKDKIEIKTWGIFRSLKRAPLVICWHFHKPTCRWCVLELRSQRIGKSFL